MAEVVINGEPIPTHHEVARRLLRLEGALQGLLAARDAVTDYYARIPDGCSADPDWAGRLIRKETQAEEAAREALKG